jgi:hypothetical protein
MQSGLDRWKQTEFLNDYDDDKKVIYLHTDVIIEKSYSKNVLNDGKCCSELANEL